MAGPAPVVVLTGNVYSTALRTVEGRDPVPAGRDETGVWQRAREGYDGYEVCDVTVLTEGGGFAVVTYRLDALPGGAIPREGEHLLIRVRPFKAPLRVGFSYVEDVDVKAPVRAVPAAS
jgi:hypothetical protein